MERKELILFFYNNFKSDIFDLQPDPLQNVFLVKFWNGPREQLFFSNMIMQIEWTSVTLRWFYDFSTRLTPFHQSAQKSAVISNMCFVALIGLSLCWQLNLKHNRRAAFELNLFSGASFSGKLSIWYDLIGYISNEELFYSSAFFMAPGFRRFVRDIQTNENIIQTIDWTIVRDCENLIQNLYLFELMAEASFLAVPAKAEAYFREITKVMELVQTYAMLSSGEILTGLVDQEGRDYAKCAWSAVLLLVTLGGGFLNAYAIWSFIQHFVTQVRESAVEHRDRSKCSLFLIRKKGEKKDLQSIEKVVAWFPVRRENANISILSPVIDVSDHITKKMCRILDETVIYRVETSSRRNNDQYGNILLNWEIPHLTISRKRFIWYVCYCLILVHRHNNSLQWD